MGNVLFYLLVFLVFIFIVRFVDVFIVGVLEYIWDIWILGFDDMVFIGIVGFGFCLIWIYSYRERGNNNNSCNDIINNYDNSNSNNIWIML